ncbi:MAG: 6-carboxytetrahydropterin synthase [Deltaproteobacteria bacterium]|nr:6-carboxytetrahydropterin synthase [Deltaproteobacteria bacterium]
MVRITRAIEFSTSLRYCRPDLSSEENERLFGPQAAKHGHNYRLEVTLRGEPDPVTGMVLDLKRFALVIHRLLLAALPEGLFDGIRLEQDSTLYVEVREAVAGVGA